MYIYIYTYNIYTHIHIHICVLMSVYICVCMRIYTYIYTYTYTYMCMSQKAFYRKIDIVVCKWQTLKCIIKKTNSVLILRFVQHRVAVFTVIRCQQ